MRHRRQPLFYISGTRSLSFPLKFHHNPLRPLGHSKIQYETRSCGEETEEKLLMLATRGDGERMLMGTVPDNLVTSCGRSEILRFADSAHLQVEEWSVGPRVLF